MSLTVTRTKPAGRLLKIPNGLPQSPLNDGDPTAQVQSQAGPIRCLKNGSIQMQARSRQIILPEFQDAEVCPSLECFSIQRISRRRKEDPLGFGVPVGVHQDLPVSGGDRTVLLIHAEGLFRRIHGRLSIRSQQKGQGAGMMNHSQIRIDGLSPLKGLKRPHRIRLRKSRFGERNPLQRFFARATA